MGRRKNGPYTADIGGTGLTDTRLEQFASLVASGIIARDAYVKAGVGGLGLSLPAASKLMEKRVQQLRDAAPSNVVISKVDNSDDVINMLIQDRELAREGGQASAAVRASELIGKHMGMFVERVDARVSVTLLDLVMESLKDVTPQ